MRGMTIGKTMPYGYAGGYARQPDMVVDTHALSGTERIAFGRALKMTEDGSVQLFGAGSAAADFAGVAAREIKSATDYWNQNEGTYSPMEAVPVFKRGCINVICQNGTPTPAGDVYVRIAANEALPTAVIGGFEAAADAANSVKLENVQWKGTADANGVAELRILTIHKA